jgi:hypothetical protein
VFQYTTGKSYAQQTMVVQKNVFGEAYDQYHGATPEERIAPPAITDVAPSFIPTQAKVPADVPFTELAVEAEAIDPVRADLVRADPVPIVQQRKFSAPHSDWDATR